LVVDDPKLVSCLTFGGAIPSLLCALANGYFYDSFLIF